MIKAGVLLWLAGALVTAATDAFGVVELFVLLGAMVVVPRATLLLGWPQPPGVPLLGSWAALAVGLAADPGPVAGALMVPWVLAVVVTVARSLLPLRIPPTFGDALPIAAGAWAVVGAVSAPVSGWGLTAFGIEEPIVRLTAVHYLVAGLGATTLGWRIAREGGRLSIVGATMTAAVPPVVALGFITRNAVPQVGGAVLLTVGVYLIAVSGIRCLPTLRGRAPKAFQVISSASVAAPMVLAVFWAAAQHADVPSLSIPDMARMHGTLNGVGFIGFGLTAWLLHDGRLRLPPLGRRRPVGLAAALLALIATGCSQPADDVVAGSPATATTSICAHIPTDQGGCGPTFEKQRNLNLRYADRVEFTGDLAAAEEVARRVRAALEPVAAANPTPPVEDVRAALSEWEPDVQVALNAVRQAGTAFGLPISGGCVFGAIYQGQLIVEIGGYINDGGCLATYAH